MYPMYQDRLCETEPDMSSPYEAECEVSQVRVPYVSESEEEVSLSNLEKPLRVIHVGQSMVRAGIEQWLKGLIRFLDPQKVQIIRCIATAENYVDPAVVSELGVPVEVGQEDSVRKAAGECDVLLCWGPRELGRWVADCPPPLCVFVAHGEGQWTRYIMDGCARWSTT